MTTQLTAYAANPTALAHTSTATKVFARLGGQTLSIPTGAPATLASLSGECLRTQLLELGEPHATPVITAWLVDSLDLNADQSERMHVALTALAGQGITGDLFWALCTWIGAAEQLVAASELGHIDATQAIAYAQADHRVRDLLDAHHTTLD